MKQKFYRLYSNKPALVVCALIFFALLVVIAGHIFNGGIASPLSQVGLAQAATKNDPEASAKAFLAASQVLLHPRCVNCHPAGDRPLQGGEQRVHAMHVVRGPEGMGKNGLWCSTCHQDKNLSGAHMPPGSPGWQLPTADVPMVFERRTPRQLCEQLKDPAQNGHRSPEDIIEHVRDAPIVIWGWHPGEGRTPAPMSHEEFVKLMTEWVEKGQACPE